MINSNLFKGMRVEVNKALPAKPSVVRSFPRICGAEYQGYINEDTGLVYAYVESVGFIHKVYCSNEFFEKLKQADLNNV